MRAPVQFSVPAESAGIKGVLEEFFDMAFAKLYIEFTLESFPNILERMLAARIQMKHPRYYRYPSRINFDCVFDCIVAIAKRRTAGKYSLLCLLPHSLFDFLPKVFNVIPRQNHVNPVD